MSELIQEKKLLTFEEICKEWSNFFSNLIECNYMIRDNQLTNFKHNFIGTDKKLYSIISAESCFVGEAHGRNRNYNDPGNPNYCQDCHYFSMYKFVCVENEIEFEEVKTDFVNHFNEVHVK